MRAHVPRRCPLCLYLCLCAYVTGQNGRQSSDGEGKTAHMRSCDGAPGSNPDFADAMLDVVASPAELVAVRDELEHGPADGTVSGAYDKGGTLEASSDTKRAFAQLLALARSLWPGLGKLRSMIEMSTADFVSKTFGQAFFVMSGCSCWMEGLDLLQSVVLGYGRCTQDQYTREHNVVLWSNLFACARWMGLGLLFMVVALEGRYCSQSSSYVLQCSLAWGFGTCVLGACAEIAQILGERHSPDWTLSNTVAIDGVWTLEVFLACVWGFFWYVARYQYDQLVACYCWLCFLIFAVFAVIGVRANAFSHQTYQYLIACAMHGFTIIYMQRQRKKSISRSALDGQVCPLNMPQTCQKIHVLRPSSLIKRAGLVGELEAAL